MHEPNGSKPITLFVSDDTALGCELLINAFTHCKYQLEILGSATHSKELVEGVRRLKPDVAVISANLEDGATAGFVAARELRMTHPETACILLMHSRDHRFVVDAFRNGARGIVTRRDSMESLCECVCTVHAGKVWAGADDLTAIFDALAASIPVRVIGSNGNELLTKRQKELVALVVQGMTNREISKQLQISEHTVKNYLFRIFDKLGVSSRAELIIYTLNQQDKTAERIAVA